VAAATEPGPVALSAAVVSLRPPAMVLIQPKGSSIRYLFELQGSRPSLGLQLRAAGVGQGGGPAAKRGRTTLTNRGSVHAGDGPRFEGAEAPCVTWVHDDHVVGDNISDWVSPTLAGVRSHLCLEAVQYGCWRARILPELTARRPAMCKWAVPTISLDGCQGVA
jgi:hypothetical protein